MPPTPTPADVTTEAPLRCPDNERWPDDIVGCGSTNLTDPDDEGLIDCRDCGIWFDPKEEA